jgi:hypothetical protein
MEITHFWPDAHVWVGKQVAAPLYVFYYRNHISTQAIHTKGSGKEQKLVIYRRS